MIRRGMYVIENECFCIIMLFLGQPRLKGPPLFLPPAAGVRTRTSSAGSFLFFLKHDRKILFIIFKKLYEFIPKINRKHVFSVNFRIFLSDNETR